MNETNKTALVIAFAVAVLLLLLFAGGTMTGATLSGGMMGNGAMGGISWIWIPTLLMLGLGVLLVWAVFGQKKRANKKMNRQADGKLCADICDGARSKATRMTWITVSAAPRLAARWPPDQETYSKENMKSQ